jgi:hypothetical protein
MSANNYILIQDTDKPCGDYEVTMRCADTNEEMRKIGGSGDLKD